MELKSLHTFLVVAEIGTILHAAKRLHCVQSNVTSRIKALEDELKVELFTRSRNGMELTAAGEIFHCHAQAVVNCASVAKASVNNFSTTVRALRIGTMESTLAVRLPSYIAALRREYPDIKLSITSGATADLVDLLLDNKIDVALIGGYFKHKNLEGKIAFTEEMVLATHRDILDLKELNSCPVIVFKPGCSYRLYAEDCMKRLALAPNEVFELGTLDGI